MSIGDEYRRQYRWRAWDTILDAIPSVKGRTILDLGCAVGDISAELVRRGATVIGVDANDDLLVVAREHVPEATFHLADLRALPAPGSPVDGIWCSFAAAYFVDLPDVLAGWRDVLADEGWIALTEVDDLFGHRPVRARTSELLAGYARSALEKQWYDFQMGSKLSGFLEASGFAVRHAFTVPDAELAFSGAADDDVLAAWRARLERMAALADFCGDEYPAVRDDLLACLARPDHRSEAAVHCCIAMR